MNSRKPTPAFAGITASRSVFVFALFTFLAGFVLPGIRLHAGSATIALSASAPPTSPTLPMNTAPTAVFDEAIAQPTAVPIPGAQTDSQAPSDASAQSAGVTIMLNTPKAPVIAGASFQVPVTLTGATDVLSFALLFHYDATKLRLVSISPGDFLNRDGEQARPIYSDSPIGHVVISIARPPGTSGLNGDGTVCELQFEAVDSGAGDLTITRASVVNSGQQVTQVKFVQPSIVVK